MDLTIDLKGENTPLIMVASLSQVAKSHTLRCDAKQSEKRFANFEKFITSIDHFCLGDFLPKPFVKGIQPKYIERLEPEGVPVINTLSIQQLSIYVEVCRYITREDYNDMEAERKPTKGDVLLTLDGGTSIGKPVLFDFEEEYAIDSHVAILRPVGLDPKYLTYLLASPLGQVQFQQAESGASGQTSVSEEDVRRFRFPVIDEKDIQIIMKFFEERQNEIVKLEEELLQKSNDTWRIFTNTVLEKPKKKISML